MRKKVIFIRGSGCVGKSTSIRYAYGELIGLGAKQLPDYFYGAGKDFLDILELRGFKIGIWSGGDVARILRMRLKTLKQERCDVIVCACHPGRKEGQRGKTEQAIRDTLRGYRAIPIDKSHAASKSKQDEENRQSATEIVRAIF